MRQVWSIDPILSNSPEHIFQKKPSAENWFWSNFFVFYPTISSYSDSIAYFSTKTDFAHKNYRISALLSALSQEYFIYEPKELISRHGCRPLSSKKWPQDDLEQCCSWICQEWIQLLFEFPIFTIISPIFSGVNGCLSRVHSLKVIFCW